MNIMPTILDQVRLIMLHQKLKASNQQHFTNNGIHDWNSLPDSIKSINDLQRFKKEVKCHLIHISEERERRVIS